MSNEIEIKLLVSQKYAEFLSQEITHFHILSQNKLFLSNTYYDTEETFFAHNKMGLRVRKENERITLTLKTEGRIVGGLHLRPEYNVSLVDEVPNLVAMQSVYPLYEQLPKAPLLPIFSTDFYRTFWNIDTGNGTEIEVALDQGNVIAGQRKEPICEVEFELKQGQIENLINFIKNLTLEDEVRLSSTSKAKRGYLLAANTSIAPQNWLEKWQLFSNLDDAVKINKLFALEQDLFEETFLLGQSFFVNDFTKTVERISAFFNLFSVYDENRKLLEKNVHQCHAAGILYLDESSLMNIIETNQYLLEKIAAIIRLHSETRNNEIAIKHLFALLQTGKFVKRQLDLILLTLSNKG